MNRILIVDDDPQVTRTFQRMFPAPEHHVDAVGDGKAGLEQLTRVDYHLIVVDYGLSDMDGGEVLLQARALSPHTVRFLVTGLADFPTVVQALNRGEVFRLIRKPWDDEELRFSVRLGLDAGRLLRERETLGVELSRKNEAVRRAHEKLQEARRSLEEELHRRTRNLLDALTSALDMRDNETQQHSRRVSIYARRLAEELSLPEGEVRVIEEGALLHDIGKIGVPDSVLLKPGPLDAAEWEVMRRHPEIGRDLLRSADFLDGARRIIFEHQEKWGGGGYPKNLKGEEICIGARIFAVVDAYDAITSDRPYRAAQSYDVALAEIRKASGTQLDPEVVAAFARVPQASWETIRDDVARLCEFQEAS